MKIKTSQQEIDPEVQMIFNELHKTYGTFDLTKKQLSNILGCSISTINKRIRSGLNLPRYRKTTEGSSVKFPLLETAKYIARTNLIEVIY